MPAPVLQFKRGNAGVAGTVPALRPGEPAISLNNFDFFIGIDTSVANNKFFGSHRYWGREDGTTSLRLKLVDKDGTNYVAIKAPDTLAGIVTYQLPGTQGGNGTVLKNDGNGNLSWGDGIDYTGINTFTNTTDNILGNADTGAVQIDGGLGVNKNVTVGAGLSVLGESYFIGTCTFAGGTINIGDSDTDDIIIAGEFASNLIPSIDETYNIGTGTKRWKNASFGGIGTFSEGLIANNVRLGISGNGVVDTNSGPLSLNSATGTTIINDHLDVIGDLDVTGNVYIGGTTVTLRGQDVIIENRDILLGVTTGILPNDTTANHGGIAIASTEGSPLVSFTATGINTFPDTYKQLMWFKSGTLGFATDAFAFNYGLAIGTTSMANGVRLAVGSGITMSDTAITASNFYGTFNGTVTGSVTGVASTAIRANTVDTTSTSTNTNYHLVFTDSASSSTGATMRVDGGIYYNPSSNNLFASQFIGDVQAATVKSSTGNTVITLSSNDATFADNINVVGLSSARAFISTSTTLQAPTAGDYSGERLRLYDFNDPAKTNYAIGAEGSHVWFGVDANNDAQGFKWYGHTTEVAKLGGTGNLTIAGDLRVNGNDIKASDGTTALTLSATSGNVKTGGDLIAGSGYLAASDGTRALYMYGTSGDVSFQGKAIVNSIRSATDSNNAISLAGRDVTLENNVKIVGITTIGTGVGVTQFSSAVGSGTSTSSVPTSSAVIDYVGTQIGNIDLTLGLTADTGGPSTVNTSQTLTINGTASEVETSVSGQTVTIGLPDAVVVGTSLSAPTVRTNLIKSQDTNETAITIAGNDVTIAGDLYVSGNTTQVNTETLTVEDTLVELGLVNGSAPGSDLDKDLGLLLNYYSGSAKKAAVFWDDSASRIVFADDVTESSGVLTVASNAYASIEIESLWVNDCAGQSQVITCTGSERLLQNITIDAGTF